MRSNSVKTADNSLLADIREVNLSYLLLAQRMLRDDYAASTFRLGFSNEVADILMRLSPAQLVKLASSSSLLCRFRFDDYGLLSALTQDVLGGALQQAHATILLAKQPVEVLA
jgi:flagellar transcriptional activator FlhD